jgi:hypothetical protein
MPATATLPETAAKPIDPKLLEAARQAIKNTDWDAFWRKVDARVAVEVEAYAKARAKSWEEFNHRVLR